ncbi:MAG: hypothetical protein HYZ51_01285 [Candidatus Doudnabacteria bacterium]|nr:hypothetical protein [Candidatus Doudnabacteria bacterium]
MFWDIKKFNRETQALRTMSLSERQDVLGVDRVKMRVMSEIASEMLIEERVSNLAGKGKSLFKAMAAALVSLGLLGGTAFASENSLPGEFLYIVKRAKEKVEIGVTVGLSKKAQVEARHAEERLKELAKLNAKAQSSSQPKSVVPAPLIFVIPSTTSTTTTLESLKAESESLEKKPKTPIQIKAQAEAEAQVDKALKALSRAEEKFKDQKNEEARKKIEQNIIKLRQKAESQGIELETKAEMERTIESREGNEIEKRKSDKEKKQKEKPEAENKTKQNEKKNTSEVKGIRTKIKKDIRNLEVEWGEDIQIEKREAEIELGF